MFTNIQNFASCKKCGPDIKLSEKCVRSLSSVFRLNARTVKTCVRLEIQKCWVKEKIFRNKQTFCIRNEDNWTGSCSNDNFLWCHGLSSSVAEKSYNNIINKLQLCSKEVAEASMQSAALEEVTLTNSSDIIISGDGTWKTRGFSSRVGVCAVIGDKTGKCIDAEVMSSSCKGYDSWKTDERGHLLTKVENSSR
ncbi:uncharacterized protein TNCV_2693351 [Trichonephila clavipes]|nr:uncharacterized protein TNCV_2693351 [Trichonephila clavipes]